MRLVSAITSPVRRSVTIRKPEPVSAMFASRQVTAISGVAANTYTHDFCRILRRTMPSGSEPPSVKSPDSPAIPVVATMPS